MVRRSVLLIKTGELKVWLRRIFIAFLFFCSIIFLLLSKVENSAVKNLDKAALRVTGPIMQVVEYPARMVHRIYTYLYDISRIYIDNRELRAENKQMLLLQNKVRSLEVENQLLGRLLNYVPPADANFISAKIIAESSDNFTHILFVYIGDEDVKKGQIVLGDESVIGRVDKVSGQYAKVILVTDINSKIPVVVERTRARGILSGDNTVYPALIFTRSTADIQEGDVIVTSGVGGMFPAGLPIGFVNSIQNGEIRVETLADISRVEYVRIVDYGLSEKQAKVLNDFSESEQNAR
ncbi:MAG: rod shape-determining protein MreC [Alphaproteobacteria bacterium]|jgi:rod shape-determining protein MreC|nr:rod shape-determining protein MreC [Alphaproteobacteria bacterium]